MITKFMSPATDYISTVTFFFSVFVFQNWGAIGHQKIFRGLYRVGGFSLKFQHEFVISALFSLLLTSVDRCCPDVLLQHISLKNTCYHIATKTIKPYLGKVLKASGLKWLRYGQNIIASHGTSERLAGG